MEFLSRLTPALAICKSNAVTTVERRGRECGGGFCLKIDSCLKITRIQARRRLADGNYSVVAPKDIFAPQIVAVHGMAASTFVEVSSAEHGTRRCPLWVKSCRDRPDSWWLLYPQKLPRLRPTGAAAKGQNRTHALQHDRTVKQPTDLPIGACYRSLAIKCV
jgi:hypothetical protein